MKRKIQRYYQYLNDVPNRAQDFLMYPIRLYEEEVRIATDGIEHYEKLLEETLEENPDEDPETIEKIKDLIENRRQWIQKANELKDAGFFSPTCPDGCRELNEKKYYRNQIEEIEKQVQQSHTLLSMAIDKRDKIGMETYRKKLEQQLTFLESAKRKAEDKPPLKIVRK